MSGANGDALEWAVALLHAPSERHGLRLRPLPDGITELLAIAAGSSDDALRAAARRFSEQEARVREAAQFYVREILLFPDADAYRVLGVEQDAERERIQTHHRLLQRWLHPDRLQQASDAVFAARVNVAWQRLRSQERRTDYDNTLRQSAGTLLSAENGLPLPVSVPAARVWVMEPPPLSLVQRWLRRVPLVLLILVCAGLLWRILQDDAVVPVRITEEVRRVSKEGTSMLDAAEAEVRLPHDSAATIASRPASNLTQQAMPSQAMRAPVHDGQHQNSQPMDGIPMRETHTVAAKVASGLASAETIAPPAVARLPARVPLAEQAPARVPEPVNIDARLPPEPAIGPLWALRPMPGEAQVSSAQLTGEQLLEYMKNPARNSPPIWNNPSIQETAMQLRMALHAHGRARIGPAQWRIGNSSAELIARLPAQVNATDGGVFTATLQWREGRWWVSGLGLAGVGVGQTQ